MSVLTFREAGLYDKDCDTQPRVRTRRFPEPDLTLRIGDEELISDEGIIKELNRRCPVLEGDDDIQGLLRSRRICLDQLLADNWTDGTQEEVDDDLI